MPASLLVTAQVAVSIRNAVKTEMEEQPPLKRLPPFNKYHYSGWGVRSGTVLPHMHHERHTATAMLAGVRSCSFSMHATLLNRQCNLPAYNPSKGNTCKK